MPRQLAALAPALTLGGLLAIAALSCGHPTPTHIPPQAPASLSGPAFDRSPLYEEDEGEGDSEPVVLHVLHTNDMHGQVNPRKGRWLNKDAPPNVGGANALAGYIEKVRGEHGEQNVLLVDSGDIFAGTPEGNLTKGQIMIDLMNGLSYDAMALGNHEFDLGAQALADLARSAEFPILAANIYPKATPQGEALKGAVTPLTIVEKAGVRIGLVGVISKRTPEMTHKDAAEAYDFDDPLTAVNDSLSTLKAEGVDFVIVLSHVGMDEEVPMIAKLESPVVALLGGHSHTQIEPMKRSESSGVVYLQTRGRTAAIDHLILEIKDGEVSVREGGPVTLLSAEWSPHPTVTEILARYTPDIEKIMSEGVGRCREPLTRTRGEIASSSLGNFVTDVMRARAGADIAITNKTGIRANLDTGQVTVRSLYEVAPFDNTIVKVKLTGAQLTTLMEYAGQNGRTYLEISGATLTYDMKRPEGSRVTAFKVKGKALDKKTTYTVATNSFLAEGGDGHKTFTEGKAEDTRVLLRDALTDFLRKEKICPAPKDTRITKK